AVPLGVVRTHHGRTHAGTPALVVPQLVVGPFDFFIERSFGEFAAGVELLHDGLGRLGELLVIEIDGSLVLFVEVLDPSRGVTTGAYILHGGAPLLPVLQFETHHRAQGVADAVADVMGGLLIAGGAHVAGGAGGGGRVVLA